MSTAKGALFMLVWAMLKWVGRVSQHGTSRTWNVTYLVIIYAAFIVTCNKIYGHLGQDQAAQIYWMVGK
jgi:hypothetical protein